MNGIKFILYSFFFNLKDFFKLDLNFYLVLFISVLKQILFIFTWSFFFDKYSKIGKWDFSAMLLMYGIVSVGVGITEIFFYGLRKIPDIIMCNMLDSYLVQPRNIILNIAVSKSDVSSFGDFLTGLILVFWSGYMFHYQILLSFAISVLFMFALYLFWGSLAFYCSNSNYLIKEIYQYSLVLATQPNSAYKGIIKIITLTIIPVAYMSFFPVQYILQNNMKYLIYSLLGTLVFLAISIMKFYIGLKRYDSGYTFVYKL